MYKTTSWSEKMPKNIDIMEVKTEDSFIQFIDLYVIFLFAGFSQLYFTVFSLLPMSIYIRA